MAATVASGLADAGFGIEAAAHQHGLAIGPLATERYFLAARTATLARPGLRAALDVIRGKSFREWVESRPGYDATGMGNVADVRAALALRP